MRAFGKNSLTDAEVFALHAKTLSDAVPQLALRTQYFSILIVCDSEQLPAEEICSFARALVDKGAMWVCTWGKGCERFHDRIDEVAVEMELLGQLPPALGESVLMTTWHERESLAGALWFLLSCVWPQDKEWETWSTVVLTIGNQAWAHEAAECLKGMDEFRKQHVEGAD